MTLKSTLNALSEAWISFRMWCKMQEMIEYHRKAGAKYPLIAAQRELSLRMTLEKCRDWASDHWREYPTIDGLKQATMDRIIKPLSRISDYEDIAALRSAIKDMPVNELLHKKEYEDWSNSIKAPRNLPKNPEYEKYRRRVLLS